MDGQVENGHEMARQAGGAGVGGCRGTGAVLYVGEDALNELLLGNVKVPIHIPNTSACCAQWSLLYVLLFSIAPVDTVIVQSGIRCRSKASR